MMTQNVTSGNIAHPDKTRGLENITKAKMILEKNAGVEKGEATVEIERRTLGAGIGARVLKEKGSQYLILYPPLWYHRQVFISGVRETNQKIERLERQRRSVSKKRKRHDKSPNLVPTVQQITHFTMSILTNNSDGIRRQRRRESKD